MEFKDFAAKVGNWLRDNICEEADVDQEVDVPMIEEKGVECCSVVYSVYVDSPSYLTSIEFFLEDLYEEYKNGGWADVTKDMRSGLKGAGMLETAQKKVSVYLDLLSPKKGQLFEELRLIRSQIARESGVPPYIVFCNRTLFEMCDELPLTREEMLALPGVGEKNYSQYGEIFLERICAFAQKNDEERRGESTIPSMDEENLAEAR